MLDWPARLCHPQPQCLLLTRLPAELLEAILDLVVGAPLPRPLQECVNRCRLVDKLALLRTCRLAYLVFYHMLAPAWYSHYWLQMSMASQKCRAHAWSRQSPRFLNFDPDRRALVRSFQVFTDEEATNIGIVTYLFSSANAVPDLRPACLPRRPPHDFFPNLRDFTITFSCLCFDDLHREPLYGLVVERTVNLPLSMETFTIEYEMAEGFHLSDLTLDWEKVSQKATMADLERFTLDIRDQIVIGDSGELDQPQPSFQPQPHIAMSVRRAIERPDSKAQSVLHPTGLSLVASMVWKRVHRRKVKEVLRFLT